MQYITYKIYFYIYSDILSYEGHTALVDRNINQRQE